MALRRDPPLITVLIAIAGVLMLVPAVHAVVVGARAEAAGFALGAGLTVLLATLLALAMAVRFRPGPVASVILGYVVLPPLLALPLWTAGAGLGPQLAWFEMVSALTTTGATVLVDPGAVSPSVHLWRGLVGWAGGLMTLCAAGALLAPFATGNPAALRVSSPPAPGVRAVAAGVPLRHRSADGAGAPAPLAAPDAGLRAMARSAQVVVPAYAALTVALWIALLLAGEDKLVAAVHAMSALATSGISPVGGLEGSAAGRLGEALILVGMAFALSRRTMPFALLAGRSAVRRANEVAGPGLARNPEVRLALGVVLGAAALMLVPAVLAPGSAADAAAPGQAVWGALFVALSFVTTTGFFSADWDAAIAWSGGAAPLLLLGGLAALGGGVATTAGGIRLMTAVVLMGHVRRELDRLVHPSIARSSGRSDRIAASGAYRAWIAFMLFLVSAWAVMSLLGLMGIEVELAIALTVAAVSTTGPLVGALGDPATIYAQLDGSVRAVLGVAMILGRVEFLALVALLLPAALRD